MLHKTSLYTRQALQATTVALLFLPALSKLSGDPTTHLFFSKLGLDQTTCLAVGLLEMSIILTMLSSRFAWIGATIGSVLISGAIIAQVYLAQTPYIAMQETNANGLSLLMGISTLFCCIAIMILNEDKYPFFNKIKAKDLRSIE